MIYLIATEDNKFCKIEFTENDIEKRMIDLQEGNPCKLKLIATIVGCKKTEGKLHKQFIRYKLIGEWFIFSDEICDYFDYSKDKHDAVVRFIDKVTGKKYDKLEKYNISIDELATMFGSKSSISFRNSSAYKRYLSATLQIINKVETEIKKKL